MANMSHKSLEAALTWYAENGVDEALAEEAVDRTKASPVMQPPVMPSPKPEFRPAPSPGISPVALGASDARVETVKLALACKTREELSVAIQSYDGIALKKTATNMVFCDGNPRAPVMLVGEAPGADEDRQGKPFVGVSGQLLDKILACIGLSRKEEDPAQAIYISNILNWRPPGNRTPSPGEVEASLPFIERHIQIIQPKILILCGGVSAKALLGRGDSISRMRTVWHNYLPQTPELREGAKPIPAIATYHPAYLLRTPSQKRAVWADMLKIQEKRRALAILP